MSWNLDDYEPVEDRLAKFWADHPDGRILTDLVFHGDGQYVVRAAIWRGPMTQPAVIPEGSEWVELPRDRQSPSATGFAEETVSDSGVNRTSALENCETSAIGRALANLGYAAKGRASREEMDKVARDPKPRSQRPATGSPMDCPDCGEAVWDNRAENDAREERGEKRRPDFKCRKCEWIQWNAETPVKDEFEPRDDVPLPELQDSDDPMAAPF